MSASKSGFAGVDIPSDDFITNCMHCGLCLPTCPTYALTGLERSSPRGRIRLIKAVAEGEIGMTPIFVEEMNFCLDCQACETACPAGVKYGALVEAARVQIENQKRSPFVSRWTKRILLRGVLSSKPRLKIAARLLGWYQQSGIERMLDRTGLVRAFSPKLAEVQKLAPRVDTHFFDERLPEVLPAFGPPRLRVGFLSGCIMNVAFAGVNRDTVEVLRRNGCEVVIPPDQECCGSLQAHNGDFEIARRLARKNIDVFGRYEIDALVMNSAGCGALMKEYGEYLKDDPAYKEKAERLSRIVKDLTEVLAKIGVVPPPRPFRHRVAYHDACHLVHAQKIAAEPRAVLAQIPGLELVELPESSWCCGSAGIYNVVQFETATALLERKMANVRETGAEIVVASNPGCLGQMNYGRSRFDVNVEIIHVATLLRRTYEAS